MIEPNFQLCVCISNFGLYCSCIGMHVLVLNQIFVLSTNIHYHDCECGCSTCDTAIVVFFYTCKGSLSIAGDVFLHVP